MIPKRQLKKLNGCFFVSKRSKLLSEGTSAEIPPETDQLLELLSLACVLSYIFGHSTDTGPRCDIETLMKRPNYLQIFLSLMLVFAILSPTTAFAAYGDNGKKHFQTGMKFEASEDWDKAAEEYKPMAMPPTRAPMAIAPSRMAK